MKQNKMKTLALVLALALVLTLAVGMLVACNPKDSQNTISKVFSEDRFNALMGYVYSADLGKEGSASVSFYYYSADAVTELNNENLTAANGVTEAILSVQTGAYDD